MGHTFGFGHSNIGDATYRNIFNVMGSAIPNVELPVLSTAYRVGAGIDAAGEVAAVTIPDAEGSATFTATLEPRSAHSGVRGLAVTPPDTQKTFYVEYRSGTGAGRRTRRTPHESRAMLRVRARRGRGGNPDDDDG